MRAPIVEFVGQISRIERLPSSKNGNPRFSFTLRASTTGIAFYMRTQVDASCAYDVLNLRNGDEVTVRAQSLYNAWQAMDINKIQEAS